MIAVSNIINIMLKVYYETWLPPVWKRGVVMILKKSYVISW